MRVLVTGGSGFIGTNYVQFLRERATEAILNVDHRAPRRADHRSFWRSGDLLDSGSLAAVRDFAPTHIVHLAARTGVHEQSLDAFAANMAGVENLLAALDGAPTLRRAVFTSSMLVCRVGYVPRHDTDYQPSTPYGESKARMEMIIRGRTNLPYAWTIIRPIAVWGPWGEGPVESLFRAIARGWFVHVGAGRYRKMFGYVENTAHQIQRLLEAPREQVDGKTMYVADTALSLDEFVETVRRVLAAPRIRHAPIPVVRAAAAAGDLLMLLGWRGAPLTTFRLRNLMTEHHYDIRPIMAASTPIPYDLSTAVARTTAWMRAHGRL